MRTFIGIKLPEKVKDDIYEIISYLKGSRADVKWVEKENLHITLKFIGEIEENTFNEIKEDLKSIWFTPFEIFLEGNGVFPNYYRPRVLWIGLRFKENTLESLFEKIEDKLLPLGIEKESRSFNPHLTLGRIRGRRNLDKLLKKFREEKIRGYRNSYLVESFSLFESILRREGPVYVEKMIYRGKDNGY